MRSAIIVCASLLVIGMSPPLQAQSRPQIIGIFSNMGIGAESGDVGGVELDVTYGKGSFYVLFQMAEGTPDVPILMTLDAKDSTVSFSFPEESKYFAGLRTFNGTVTRTGIRGSFANGYSINLRRLECRAR